MAKKQAKKKQVKKKQPKNVWVVPEDKPDRQKPLSGKQKAKFKKQLEKQN